MPFAEKQLETRLPAADRPAVPGVGLFLVDDHLVGVIEVNKLNLLPTYLTLWLAWLVCHIRACNDGDE